MSGPRWGSEPRPPPPLWARAPFSQIPPFANHESAPVHKNCVCMCRVGVIVERCRSTVSPLHVLSVALITHFFQNTWLFGAQHENLSEGRAY